jgi:hypothetical protein
MGRPARFLWTSPIAAAVTLMVLSAFLPEVCSGNTLASAFLTPKVFLFLVIVGYGIPVLLIRELAIRKHLATAGILIAGFGYGSYNEGLWAKTMIVTNDVPIPAFNHYGELLGVVIPWALLISTWHALASVLFPIVLTHALFPDQRAKPWLDVRLAFGLAAAALALGSFAFLQPFKHQGTSAQLAVFLAVIIGGGLLATLFKKPQRPQTKPAGVLPVLLGISTLPPFVGLILLAAMKVPPATFIAAMAIVVGAHAASMALLRWQDPPNLTLFALGFYIQTLFVSTAVGVAAGKAPVEPVVVAVVLGGSFIWAAMRINIRPRAGASEPPLAAYR